MKYIAALGFAFLFWFAYELIGKLAGWPDITVWHELTLFGVGVAITSIVAALNL